MKARIEFSAALVLQILGAGLALLIGTREWQTITTVRQAPLPQVVLSVSGRTVDSAPTAFALVALAGVVAVLATKGLIRRLIGALVALAGIALVWRCADAIGAVSTGRARMLVRNEHSRVIQSAGIDPHISTHPVWGLLSCGCGALIVVAGLMIAVRGGRWAAMSARYESPQAAKPVDTEQARARADVSLWNALERGEDPTAHAPRDGS